MKESFKFLDSISINCIKHTMKVNFENAKKIIGVLIERQILASENGVYILIDETAFNKIVCNIKNTNLKKKIEMFDKVKPIIMPTGNTELDKILGGGFSKRGIYVVASKHGNENTSFLFETVKQMANKGNFKLYYLHTDLFDQRILKNKNIKYEVNDISLYYDLEKFCEGLIRSNKVDALIIDTLVNSLNTKNKGFVRQIKDLSSLAKKLNIAIIISVNIDKEAKPNKNSMFGDSSKYVKSLLIINDDFKQNQKDATEYDSKKVKLYVYNNKNQEIARLDTKIKFDYSDIYSAEEMIEILESEG